MAESKSKSLCRYALVGTLSIAFLAACASRAPRDVASSAGLIAAKVSADEYEITSENTVYRLRFVSPTSFHLTQKALSTTRMPELMIVTPDESRSSVDSTLAQASGIATISSKALDIRVTGRDAGAVVVTVSGASGVLLDNWTLEPKRHASSLRLASGEHVYGFGDKRAAIDQRGNVVEIENHDAFASETNKSYKSIPFFYTSRNYGLFLHDYHFATYDVGAANRDLLSIESRAGNLDFYFFSGADPKSVLAQYTELTGRPAMLPRWAFGFHQSKASYSGRDAFRVGAEMRQRRLPVDAIYYDDWDEDAATKTFVSDLWRKHRIRLTVGGNPFEIGRGDFMEELGRRGYLMTDAKGKWIIENPNEIGDDAGTKPEDSAYVDFFNPAAGKFFVERKWKPGIDSGIVLGMADFGELDYIENADKKFWPSLGLSVAETRNIYGLAYGTAMVENARRLQAANGGGRSTGMVRPGFAGTQRLGWTTTGDSLPTYDNFRAHLRGFLNLAMSGFSNIGYDIGGWDAFSTDLVYGRWFAAGTFNPFMWAHGQQDHEPYVHGEKVEAAARTFLELRYRLLPFLYSLHEAASRTGVPMVRPLALQEPTDPVSSGITDQFFLGDSVLVAPVFNDEGSRRVYLPAGEWYDFFSEEAPAVAGRQVINVGSTPLDRLPVYVQAGSILPLGPVMQYSTEKPVDHLEVNYYARKETAGEKTALFTLYEDDGETGKYLKGAWQRTFLRVRQDAQRFVFDMSVKNGDGKFRAAPRSISLRLHGLSKDLSRVSVNGVPATWAREGTVSVVTVPPSKTEGLVITAE